MLLGNLGYTKELKNDKAYQVEQQQLSGVRNQEHIDSSSKTD